MKATDIDFTPKFKALLKSDKQIIHCEGVTGSGKSFQLGVKFFFRVFNSPKEDTQFVIAASSVGQVEKIVILQHASFYNIFKPVMEHHSASVGGNHIEMQTPTGTKIIYLVGYDDKKRFQTILGLDIKGFLTEEAHIAGDAFIREMFTRVYRNQAFLLTSSNGGLPDIVIYKDYLNKARPHPDYAHEVPESTMQELLQSEADDNYEFWYYKFEDNPALDEDDIKQMYKAHPVGSFEYNSKILGIRGFVEGAIYAKYMSLEKNMVKFDDLFTDKTQYPFYKYTIGIDVGSTDYTVFTLTGFTYGFKEAIMLDREEINHAGADEIWGRFRNWFEPHFRNVARKMHGVFIDSAAQILKATLAPRLMADYGLSIADSFKFTIKERVDWGIRFLHDGRLKFTERTEETYRSFQRALYTENMKGTDIREFSNHKDKDNIDSGEYSITPFIREMLRA